MMLKLHNPWLLGLLVTRVAAQADAESSLLQLRDDLRMVDALRGAKTSCLKGGHECISQLQAYRILAWPQVRTITGFEELSEQPDWFPKSLVLGADDGFATLPCPDQQGELHMFYRHIFKNAGHTIMDNMKQAEGSIFKLGNGNRFCLEFDPNNPQHFSFTFVREPISRFVAAYAELETRVRWGVNQPLMDVLAPLPAHSLERAEAFFEEFLKNGIWDNGHTLPQLEWLGDSGGCPNPIHFVGYVENLPEQWNRMLKALPCQAIGALNETLGLHPNDSRDAAVIKSLLKPGSDADAEMNTSSLTRDADGLRRLDSQSMERMLRTSQQHLRALCWIYLPDFVAFGYDLPPECQEDSELQRIFERSRSGPE